MHTGQFSDPSGKYSAAFKIKPSFLSSRFFLAHSSRSTISLRLLCSNSSSVLSIVAISSSGGISSPTLLENNSLRGFSSSDKRLLTCPGRLLLFSFHSLSSSVPSSGTSIPKSWASSFFATTIPSTIVCPNSLISSRFRDVSQILSYDGHCLMASFTKPLICSMYSAILISSGCNSLFLAFVAVLRALLPRLSATSAIVSRFPYPTISAKMCTRSGFFPNFKCANFAGINKCNSASISLTPNSATLKIADHSSPSSLLDKPSSLCRFNHTSSVSSFVFSLKSCISTQ
ncbi:hypothetical protein ES703_85525 [subsurface metagenome]